MPCRGFRLIEKQQTLDPTMPRRGFRLIDKQQTLDPTMPCRGFRLNKTNHGQHIQSNIHPLGFRREIP